MTHQKRTRIPGGRPFRKGPRYDRESWRPRNRCQRRWAVRVELERRAAYFGVVALPGELSSALRLRIMDKVSPSWRRNMERARRAAQRAEDAANPLKATGADLEKLAEVFGVIVQIPAQTSGGVIT